jgi:hypothetical protein
MPIREFSPRGVPRAKIAFFKELPTAPDLVRFKERNFQCVSCTEKEVQDSGFTAQLDAVVFSQKPEKLNGLESVMRATIPDLLNNGVSVYVRIAQDPNKTGTARRLVKRALLEMGIEPANIAQSEWEQIPNSMKERQDSRLIPYVYVFDSGAAWPHVAHTICDHPAGASPNNQLRFEGLDINALGTNGHQHKEQVLLLQRAFSDCSVVHIQAMVGGLSGASVFKVYASLRDGLAGDRPYLYFTKMGPRKKIADEYDKYVGRALDYIPFHLGPRLRLDRCNLGASQGILVGDFVEGAEPMRDCAPAGRAGHAIANLFDKTLGAWRKQSKVDQHRTLGERLAHKWMDEKKGRQIKLPAARARIVEKLGGNPAVAPARTVFCQHSQSLAWCGPAHGDLHATNVLVRSGDAIIIDFEKMEDEFPMLYDPASLEGGLLVEAFANDPRSGKEPGALLKSILPLYSLDALRKSVIPCHAADSSSWFYDCVTQIRATSRHHEETTGQYALVLALCLMRKGCNPQVSKERALQNLRAISFVIGQKILMQIKQRDEQRSNLKEPDDEF